MSVWFGVHETFRRDICISVADLTPLTYPRWGQAVLGDNTERWLRWEHRSPDQLGWGSGPDETGSTYRYTSSRCSSLHRQPCTSKTHSHLCDPRKRLQMMLHKRRCVMWHTNIPPVGTGNDGASTAPGHPGYMKPTLYSTGMLKTMMAWNLQTWNWVMQRGLYKHRPSKAKI